MRTNPSTLRSSPTGWAAEVIDHLSELVLLLTDEWTVEWGAPSLADHLGHQLDDLRGSSFFALLHPDDQLRLRSAAAVMSVMGGAAEPMVIRLRHRRGDWRTFEATVTSKQTASGVGAVVVSGRDITIQCEVQERLAHSEEWVQTVLGGSTEALAVTDPTGVVRFASGPTEQILGYRPDELIGTSQLHLIHPEDVALAHELLGATGDEAPGAHHVRIRHRDGTWRTVEAHVENMLDNPAVGGMVFRARDVTHGRFVEDLLGEQTDLLEAIARQAPLEITLQRITQMVEHVIEGAHCAIGVLDGDGTIRVRAAPHVPPGVVSFLDEFDPAATLAGPLAECRGEILSFDLRDGSEGGRSSVFRAHGYQTCRIAGIGEASGELIGAVEVFETTVRDLTTRQAELLDRAVTLAAIAIERQRAEAALEYRARFDALTGLANRTLIEQRITEAVERSSRIGAGVAILHLDLDRFKIINDALGHARGDELLQLVAKRLHDIVRPGDTLGRLGGDEFVVVCSRVLNEAAVSVAAERFLASLAEPFTLDGESDIFLTASIGIAYTAADGAGTAESLLRDADVASYRAKDQGRSQYVAFQENVDQRAVELLAYEQALRVAIERNEFELHYQPVVRLADSAMTHVEALVRWDRPGHGLVSPAQFIPVAEESGLIVPLGWWILEEACKEAAAWPRLPDGSQVEVAVNLSARQLASEELVPAVERALALYGLEPHRLCFEVTESALVRDVEHAKTALNAIKALGVNLAIDDFGTGYASLDYVRHFTMADYLKIDRAFVEGVDTPGSHEEAIVTAAIAMARSLGLTVIAEGVETQDQMEALRLLECELAQGFLFSRPVPLGAARALLGGIDLAA